MTQETKIEFYKNRTLGERFAATGDFIRQNWRVLLKNIAYIGVPLALIQGFFMQNYAQGVFSLANVVTNPYSIYSNINWISYLFTILFSILLNLFLFSMTGAILNKYLKGSLTENTGWADLKDNVFSLAGQLFIQGLILCAGIAVIAFFAAIIIGLVSLVAIAGGAVGGVLTAIVALLILGLLFAVLAPLCLIVYPLFFENASAWEAITKGFRLGFRYWGSTFVTVFLGGLLSATVSYILAMPYIVYILFNMGQSGWVGYILAMISSLVGIIIYPVLIVFLSFQYTSIIEREEGISLQSKVEEFDKL
jgi:hypothetical protein